MTTLRYLILPLMLCAASAVSAQDPNNVQKMIEVMTANGCVVNEANQDKVLKESGLPEVEARKVVQALFLSGRAVEMENGDLRLTVGDCK